MTAETTHKHSFPIQPPHGSIFGPGPCDCGKTYARAQAEKQLAEALAAMDATEPADAPAGNRYETVASGSAGETTPGRAAYEAYAVRITELRAQYAGVDFPSAAPQPWDRLSETFHEGWEAAAQYGHAAIVAWARAQDPPRTITAPAGEHDGGRILALAAASLVRTMEAARIEMIQNGPAAAMQWILNGLPDQYDGEYAWDGKESAEAWLDRVEAADRAEAAAVTPTGTEPRAGTRTGQTPERNPS